MTVLVCGAFSQETVAFAERLALSLENRSSALKFAALLVDALPSGGAEFVQTTFPVHTLTSQECLTRKISQQTAITMSDLVRGEKFATVKFVALKLLNRSDFTGTFRLLEREVFLHSALLSVVELLTSIRPSLLVFPVSPHQFLPYVVSEVARFLGIRTLQFQPCPLTFAMVPRIFEGSVEIPATATVGESSVFRELLASANQQILKLQNSIDPRYMEIQRSRDELVRKSGSKVHAFFLSLRWIFSERFPQAINFSGHASSGGFFRGIARVALTRSLEQTLRNEARRSEPEVVGAELVAVFAMHYEPERTSLPDGLPIEFQGDAIAHISALLPTNFSLVVKEHYSQQSAALRGFLGRSPLFYDAMKSYPNTSFAPVQSKLTDLVRGSQVVFTLTGTVAIEAVFAGKPVGYFGSPWWEGMPGTIRVEPGVRFEEIRSISMPESTEIISFLQELIAQKMIPGVASESAEVVESRLGEIPAGFLTAEAESVAQLVMAILETRSTE